MFIGFSHSAFATLVTSFSTQGNVSIEIAAYPDQSFSSSSGNLTISTIPVGATIEFATLYGNNYFNSGVTPTAIFNGNNLGSWGV